MDSIRTQREYTEKYLEDIPKWDMTKVVDSFGLVHLVAIRNERNSGVSDSGVSDSGVSDSGVSGSVASDLGAMVS